MKTLLHESPKKLLYRIHNPDSEELPERHPNAVYIVETKALAGQDPEIYYTFDLTKAVMKFSSGDHT